MKQNINSIICEACFGFATFPFFLFYFFLNYYFFTNYWSEILQNISDSFNLL